jgi:hypothetical protein
LFVPSTQDVLAHNVVGSLGQNGALVWRLDEKDKVQAIAVTTGAADGQNTIILSGAISEGQEVIIGEVVQPEKSQFFGIRLGF